MKKFFLTLLTSLLILAFFSLKTANAQTPPPEDQAENALNPNETSIPGVNCGDARNPDPLVQRCCVPPEKKSFGQQVVDQVVPDLFCLINVPVPGPIDIKGFCLGDIVRDALQKKIDDSSPGQAINEVREQTPIKKCITGKADGKGNSCKCVETYSSAALCDAYLITKDKSGNEVRSPEYDDCVRCSRTGVWTGASCMYISSTGAFIQNNVFGLGVGLAGVAALICIIYSAFILQTSQGNPERIKKAREYLTACLIGLALIIFSVFILRLIGLTILGIPGFT